MASLQSKKKWEYTVKSKEQVKPETLFDLLLESRGVDDKDTFLNPKFDQLPDFHKLYDAKSASKKIVEAIKADKHIVIHGDFDADGISATAILWEFLYKRVAELLGKEVNVTPYIPDRVDEGYGLSENSISSMKKLGAELIVTVDCGVRDKELIQKYLKEDDALDFIVTDHHQPPEDIIEGLNYPLVHQMYPEHEFPDTHISGAAVTWFLIQNIKEELGIEGYSKTFDGLDLVALSTVTDIMPLKGANRIIVSEGLKLMRKGVRLGLNKLAQVAGVNPKIIQAYHLGFVIGPRINAAGRIGSPMEALRLLLTDDNQKALKRAAQLNAKNAQRQLMTDNVLEEAREQIISRDGKDILNFVVGSDWAEGIIGLVAGKLQEEFGKPAIVATVNGDEARGSARSFGPLNITKEIEGFKNMLTKYGGHAQAAGFSTTPDKIEQFREDLTKKLNKSYKQGDFSQTLKIALSIDPEDIDFELFDLLDQMRPFGMGNPKPVLSLDNVVITNIKDMGDKRKHMKLTLKGNGIGQGEVVMFNCDDDFDKLSIDDSIDIAGTLSINEWNGNKSVQFIAKEWKFTEN